MVVVLRVSSETLYDRLTARYVVSWNGSLQLQPSFPFYFFPLSLCWRQRTLTEKFPRLNLSSGARKYPEAKLQENLDSEIMEVLLEEAREAYDEEIVVELISNTAEELDSNVDRIEAWVRQWKEHNSKPGT